jgi:Spy/CpxP family protein refolding chaperone
MKHRIQSSLVVAFLLLAVSTVGASPQTKAAPPRPSKGDAASQFHDAMHKLWEDHITWTRLYIVSAAADLPDKQATTERLLQNQVDIGNAIKPYYGNDAGEKLTGLLKDHITIAAELVTAAKAGNSAQVEDANRRWLVNADAIAEFLSGANPSAWPSGEMKQMMHDHLSLTTAEVQDRLKGNYAADIADYEKVHVQILRMADMLSDGIIHQFPKKF